MKLLSAHATNFRCIDDSNPVDIGSTTCLVGKNESGKTAFLKALEGLRSVDSGYKEYNRTEDYPRRHLTRYDERHKEDDAQVIATVWQLEQDDKDALVDALGECAGEIDRVKIYKSYGSIEARWSVPIDESEVLQGLIERFNLTMEEKEPIRKVTRTDTCADVLEELESLTTSQSAILDEVNRYPENSAELFAINILETRTPRFLYFSHYDRMSGQVSINQLNRDTEANQVSDSDRVFLDFLEFAGTRLNDLVDATKFEELNALCEAAANDITDQMLNYWTQNDRLTIQVRLDEGKSEDPAPFNSGPVARARVRNELHRVSVPFSERSAGFIWFFSFLVKFAQIKESHDDVIILLDEPGLSLHGTAQKDLLRYFEEQLEPNHQLIYTTHSPFMVPADKLFSVRTVEDVVQRDERGRERSVGTKVCADALTTDPQTNFPLLGAIGYEVTQSLIIGPNTLLVEGPSDILYLQAASNRLKSLGRTHLDSRWAVCPSGGIDKVLPFVRLFRGNNLNTVVLTDFQRGQRRALDRLRHSGILEAGRIILATDIANKEEADIEDFFTEEFFATLLNDTYGFQGEHRLDVANLIAADEDTVRNVKRAEAHSRRLPNRYPIFGHYDPAHHLLTHPALLEVDTPAVNESLKRFEAVFERISRFTPRACSSHSVPD